MTAQLPSRVYRIGNPENDDHCFTDKSKSAADAIKNGYEVSEYVLAAHEQEPVAVYRLVPLDALGAACGALQRYAPDSNTLKLLRRYTFGDLSNQSTHPAPVPAVPEKIPESVYQVIYEQCGGFVDCDANPQKIWNACRAAVLNEGKS